MSKTARKVIEITITQRISVDAEIADEIVWLNQQGVRTEGSCSGHGSAKPTAMIIPSNAKRAEELGYAPRYCEGPGYFEITLQGTDYPWPNQQVKGWEGRQGAVKHHAGESPSEAVPQGWCMACILPWGLWSSGG